MKVEPRIRWRKLKEKDCYVKFRENVSQMLSSSKEVLDSWQTTSEEMRETAIYRRVIGVTHGQRKEQIRHFTGGMRKHSECLTCHGMFILPITFVLISPL